MAHVTFIYYSMPQTTLLRSPGVLFRLLRCEPNHSLYLILSYYWGTSHIGQWIVSIKSCPLLICYASFQRQYLRYISTKKLHIKLSVWLICCILWVKSEAPNPVLFLLGLITQFRRPCSILVGRSWWGFWLNPHILRHQMSSLQWIWRLWYWGFCFWKLASLWYWSLLSDTRFVSDRYWSLPLASLGFCFPWLFSLYWMIFCNNVDTTAIL